MNNLEIENQVLKQKLKVAQKWIKREILANIKSINISKTNSETKTKKDSFFSENIEEIIYHKTMDFLWEEIFMYASKDVLEYVISSEILFFTLRNNKNLDWLWIITSYQKSFDLLVEEHITKPFRKYFHSKKIFPVDLETFWAKRHIWKVDFEDVVATRKYFLWDLENKNCLFYKLFQIYDSPL